MGVINNTIESIAEVCHETNKTWYEKHGDFTQKHWADAEQWQRDSALIGVKYRMDYPTAPKSAQHASWMKDKLANGWVYGIKKDAVAKTHPCLVPFNELPLFQQKKDELFCVIVDALK